MFEILLAGIIPAIFFILARLIGKRIDAPEQLSESVKKQLAENRNLYSPTNPSEKYQWGFAVVPTELDFCEREKIFGGGPWKGYYEAHPPGTTFGLNGPFYNLNND